MYIIFQINVFYKSDMYLTVAIKYKISPSSSDFKVVRTINKAFSSLMSARCKIPFLTLF